MYIITSTFIEELGSTPLVVPNYFLQTCESTTSYQAQADDELSFEAGETVRIVLQNGNGWYVQRFRFLDINCILI